MIGILVILVVSGLLLWFVEKKNLLVLGPLPLLKRTAQFLLGFSLFLALSLGLILLEFRLKNPAYSWQIIFDLEAMFQASWYHLKSALTEDLMFRGALLYILIRRLGARTGILLSALAFGVYHWFSYGMLNEGWLVLTVVFIMTGLMGWAWAYVFHRSKSMLLGWGMHTGWNLGMAFLSGSEPHGEVLLAAPVTGELSPGHEILMLGLKMFLPPLVASLLVFRMKR